MWLSYLQIIIIIIIIIIITIIIIIIIIIIISEIGDVCMQARVPDAYAWHGADLAK